MKHKSEVAEPVIQTLFCTTAINSSFPLGNKNSTFPSLTKILIFFVPQSTSFPYILMTLCSYQHIQTQRSEYFSPKLYKAKTRQRHLTDLSLQYIQSTHGNCSHYSGVLRCFLPGTNLTYYVISKANGAEGDKCKVNSFTVGPALCYLEED